MVELLGEREVVETDKKENGQVGWMNVTGTFAYMKTLRVVNHSCTWMSQEASKSLVSGL